jgi:hypothetical protein
MQLGLEQAIPTARDAIEGFLQDLLGLIQLTSPQETFGKHQKLVLIIETSG